MKNIILTLIIFLTSPAFAEFYTNLQSAGWEKTGKSYSCAGFYVYQMQNKQSKIGYYTFESGTAPYYESSESFFDPDKEGLFGYKIDGSTLVLGNNIELTKDFAVITKSRQIAPSMSGYIETRHIKHFCTPEGISFPADPLPCP